MNKEVRYWRLRRWIKEFIMLDDKQTEENAEKLIELIESGEKEIKKEYYNDNK